MATNFIASIKHNKRMHMTTQTQLQPVQTPAMWVISHTIVSTLNSITQDIGNLPEQLCAELASLEIPMVGPITMEYRGCTEDPNATFDLEIACPVAESTVYQGKYAFKQWEAFKGVEDLYEGTLQDLGAHGWEPFMQNFFRSGLQMGLRSREVYERFEMNATSGNRILLQAEIL
jgi:hypothetical protein